MRNLKNLRNYSPALARYGVGIVFFIFGISQLLSPENWIRWLPSFILNTNISPLNLIYINGIFDLIVGLLLLTGFFVRIVAFLGSLHLLGIIISLGYNDIAIRDLGLLIVLISVFLHGPDKLSLQTKLKNKDI